MRYIVLITKHQILSIAQAESNVLSKIDSADIQCVFNFVLLNNININTVKHTYRALLLLTSLILLLILPGITFGQNDRTWDGGSNQNSNWTNNRNWTGTGNGIAPVSGDGVIFEGNNRTTNNNDFTAGTTFRLITFNSGASLFTLEGNSINLTGDITNNSKNSQIINLNITTTAAIRTIAATSGNITIGGIISGTGGILKTGANILILSNANTYTGLTTISDGTLTLAANNALPISSSAGLIQFAAGTPTFNLGLFNLGSGTNITTSAGQLDFDVNTTVNLGASGTNAYYFKASNGQTWNATTVTINNWAGTSGSSGTGRKIYIGNNGSGLTDEQLAKISFTGYTSGAQLLATGELVPVVTPTITSFTPTSACSGSGVSVVLTGTNFTGATAVTFNGINVAYTVNSASQITATLPPGATTGKISITTPRGSVTSSSIFTVNSVPSVPSIGAITQPTCAVATGSVVLNGLPSTGMWTLIRSDGVKTTGTGESITLYDIPPGTYTYSVTNEDMTTACPGTGTGLLAEYFNNVPTSGVPVISGNPNLTRTDQGVNFDWGNGGPGSPVNVDYFSVRWTGKVQPCFSENYTFTTRSDDGIRLWINGIQVINNWGDHAATDNSGTINLTAGQKYDLVLEFYERAGQAVAQLSWSSPSQANQIIPMTQLYSVATGCTSAPSSSVIINPQPTNSTAPTSITGTTTICNGSSTTLSVSGGTLGIGASWMWYSNTCGGTSVGTGNSISVSPTTTTTYYVRAEGCNTTTCASITVTVRPAPTLASVSATPTSACAGSNVTVTANGLLNGSNTVSYDYVINGVVTSATADLAATGHTASTILSNLAAGNYEIRIKGITVNGCTINFTENNLASWTVNAFPVINNPGPQVACDSYTLPAITGTNLSGNQKYYNNSQASGGTVITGPITSTQTVWIYDINGTCSDEESFLVTINPLPTNFTVTGGGTYCGTAVGIGLSGSQTGVNYQLYRDGSTFVETVAGTGLPISFTPQTILGTYTVKAIGSSGCENNMTNNAVISADTEAPVARCKDISVNLDANGQATITPEMINNGSTDNCGIASMSVSPSVLSCTNVSGSGNGDYTVSAQSADGNTTVKVTLTNIKLNLSQQWPGTYNAYFSFDYSINVTGNPVTSFYTRQIRFFPMNQSVNLSGNSGSDQTPGFTLSGVYSSDIPVEDVASSIKIEIGFQTQSSQLSNTIKDLTKSGGQKVALTVTDAAGKSSTCQSTVTLNDVTPPTIICPANITVSADANSCAATSVNLGTPTTADNCGVKSVTNNAPVSFPVGNTIVKWTITDNAGNSNTCNQTVTVSPNPVDVAVADLGDSCQSGDTGTQSTITWIINKLSGAGNWGFTWKIKNDANTEVASGTKTGLSNSSTTVSYTANNTAGVNQTYTIEITGVTDNCGTSDMNTANNSDSVTLLGIPVIGSFN